MLNLVAAAMIQAHCSRPHLFLYLSTSLSLSLSLSISLSLSLSLSFPFVCLLSVYLFAWSILLQTQFPCLQMETCARVACICCQYDDRRNWSVSAIINRDCDQSLHSKFLHLQLESPFTEPCSTSAYVHSNLAPHPPPLCSLLQSLESPYSTSLLRQLRLSHSRATLATTDILVQVPKPGKGVMRILCLSLILLAREHSEQLHATMVL